MTKLIKASTALKRAEAVDVAGVVLSNIAEQINRSAGVGRTSCHVWVPDEYSEYVTEKLLDAGYVLEFGEMFDEIVDFIEDTRGRIRRFLDRLLGREPISGAVFQSRPNRNDLTISWAPAPEAVDDESVETV